MSEQQQKIYNTWLRVTRSKLNKPYRLRKKFDNMSETILKDLQRLESFFIRNKDVNMYDFFVAPLHIHSDNKEPTLAYYTTMKAINVYKIYKKHIEKPNN